MKKLIILVIVILGALQESRAQPGGIGFWQTYGAPPTPTCNRIYMDWTTGTTPAPDGFYFGPDGNFYIGTGYGPYSKDILQTGVWQNMIGTIPIPGTHTPYQGLKPGFASGNEFLLGTSASMWEVSVPYPLDYYHRTTLGINSSTNNTHYSIQSPNSVDPCDVAVTSLAIPHNIPPPAGFSYGSIQMKHFSGTGTVVENFKAWYYYAGNADLGNPVYVGNGDTRTYLGTMPTYGNEFNETEARTNGALLGWFPNPSGTTTYAIIQWWGGGFTYNLLAIYRITESAGVEAVYWYSQAGTPLVRSTDNFNIAVAGWDNSGNFHGTVVYYDSGRKAWHFIWDSSGNLTRTEGVNWYRDNTNTNRNWRYNPDDGHLYTLVPYSLTSTIWRYQIANRGMTKVN